MYFTVCNLKTLMKLLTDELQLNVVIILMKKFIITQFTVVYSEFQKIPFVRFHTPQLFVNKTSRVDSLVRRSLSAPGRFLKPAIKLQSPR